MAYRNIRIEAGTMDPSSAASLGHDLPMTFHMGAARQLSKQQHLGRCRSQAYLPVQITGSA